MDPSSLANLSEVRCTHLHLNLAANFETKVLSGEVTHSLHLLQEAVAEVVFDTRGLSISRVLFRPSHYDAEAPQQCELDFSLDDSKTGPLGTPLRISLARAYETSLLAKEDSATFFLVVSYQTSPDSSGIQWLAAAQTDGKEYPYLFTQFQAIHCRSGVPCQDSPRNKVTYTAQITVPEPLTALMSAPRDEKENTHSNAAGENVSTFFFRQPVPIPTYLLALVIGKLSFRQVGPRTKVWAEEETVEKAAWEFANTDEYLALAEKFLSPYEWGDFDLLCLPGSFPYGGMENPCLSFITPTLLAGDRSLTTVVAHELCHSWTGNLVTSATWQDFWLNEGFTVYAERKLYALMGGEPARHLDYILGHSALLASIAQFGDTHPFTALVPTLDNQTDPDDVRTPHRLSEEGLIHLSGIQQHSL